MDTQIKLLEQLAKTAAPALEADAGELYFVSASDREVHLHLAGSYAGCPGVGMLRQRVLGPLVAELYPNAELKLSSGLPQPNGAQRVEPAKS